MTATALARWARHQSRGRALLFKLAGAAGTEVGGHGSWVHTGDGRRLLDLGSYAIFLPGRLHPAVVDAVAGQLRRMPVTSRAFPDDPAVAAAEALAERAPGPLDKVLFCTSGAEAVEAAAKLARAATGRTALVHLERSFHGKTLGALSLTDSPLLRAPVAGALTGTVRASRTDPAAAFAAVRAGRPAAVFVEPVQGEGGIHVVAPAVLAALRAACDEVGALLVCDEIQSGLGRTGRWWACEAADVVPDVLLAGKGLGGGVVPVAALVATRAAFAPFDRDPLLHTSTFAGTPLATTAARATLGVIEQEQLVARAATAGAGLDEVLAGLVARFPDAFTEVTGRGLMRGLRCRTAEISGCFVREALAASVVVTPCLTSPDVIRFTPPLTIGDDELAFAAGALGVAAARALEEIEDEHEGGTGADGRGDGEPCQPRGGHVAAHL